MPLPDDDRHPAAGDALANRELATDLGRALAVLPPEQRVAVVLVDAQGYPLDEVSPAARRAGRHGQEPLLPRPGPARRPAQGDAHRPQQGTLAPTAPVQPEEPTPDVGHETPPGGEQP